LLHAQSEDTLHVDVFKTNPIVLYTQGNPASREEPLSESVAILGAAISASL
jgi:hypothetical protein